MVEQDKSWVNAQGQTETMTYMGTTTVNGQTVQLYSQPYGTGTRTIGVFPDGRSVDMSDSSASTFAPTGTQTQSVQGAGGETLPVFNGTTATDTSDAAYQAWLRDYFTNPTSHPEGMMTYDEWKDYQISQNAPIAQNRTGTRIDSAPTTGTQVPLQTPTNTKYGGTGVNQYSGAPIAYTPPTNLTLNQAGTGNKPEIVSIGGYDYEHGYDAGGEYWTNLGPSKAGSASSGEVTESDIFKSSNTNQNAEADRQAAMARLNQQLAFDQSSLDWQKLYQQGLLDQATGELDQQKLYQAGLLDQQTNELNWMKIYQQGLLNQSAAELYQQTAYQNGLLDQAGNELDWQKEYQQGQLDLQNKQLEQDYEQWQKEFEFNSANATSQLELQKLTEQHNYEQNLWNQKFQESELAWSKEQFAQEQAAQREERLATLAAQPKSWIEYANLSKTTPVIQPWMMPLMGDRYEGTVSPQPMQTTMGQTQTEAPMMVDNKYNMPLTPQVQPGTSNQQLGTIQGTPQVGAPIPGWTPTDNTKMPGLLNPSAQYMQRIAPAMQEQYYGYQQARTGARPEDEQWRLWNMAPPSKTNTATFAR